MAFGFETVLTSERRADGPSTTLSSTEPASRGIKSTQADRCLTADSQS